MTDTRRLDLLDLHDNVSRRVRNLETGVHPLRAIADWYESIPPTLFEKDAGGSDHLATTSSGSNLALRYQKRAGIGALLGVIHIGDPQNTDLQDTDGAYWGTLPEAMRPTLTHKFIAFADNPPYVAQVAVLANGQLRVHGGALPASPELGIGTTINVDGLTWPVA